MSDLDPVQLNITGVTQLVSSKINKIPTSLDDGEGVEGEREDVLSLDLDDDKLLELRNTWVSKYMEYEASIKTRQEANLAYYKGRQMEGTPYATDLPIASNLQWESAETFYAAALSKNPEPVVYSDNSPEGNDLAGDIKTMLQYHADYLDLRALLVKQTRQWSIYLLGGKKWGWDADVNEICCDVRKIKDFIFDTDGYVDTKGHFVGYLGERITVTAEKLIELFPKHADYITLQVDGKLGTSCVYTEWWTDDFCFVTFKQKVLDKHKNEFFNYGSSENDQFGLPIHKAAKNHFPKPLKPYTFLSVYSLGEQPHDITGLLEQNIPNQNLITKRTMQIDLNLSRQNNSDAFSEKNFTQETAKQAAGAFAKGNPVLVPEGGPINEAIVRFPAEGFPDAAFRELEQNKENLRSSWGIQGLTAQPGKEDTTARGMILNQQYDNTRIGGGIGEAIERVAKADFNWIVQLYYVYYDQAHFGAILGQMKATEFVTISSEDIDRKLIVSVSPDSMKPKDEITTMNQALTLWQEGALDPQTLLTILNFPNPKETAAQSWLYHTNPQLYGQLNFPDLQQMIASLNPALAQPNTPGTNQPPSASTPGEPGQGQPVAPLEQPASTGGVPASPDLSQVPLPA